MLVLLQIINVFIKRGYSQTETFEMFNEIVERDIPLEILLGSEGIEIEESQLERLYSALPKYESAIKISYLKAQS